MLDKGLGLPIVNSILLQNGASLWADTSLGQGTTMTLAWPAEPINDAANRDIRRLSSAIPPLPQVDTGLLVNMQVLVVDDLPDVAHVLAEMLKSTGATAFAESDPEKAKKLLAVAPDEWDVLVTDLHMPGSGGDILAEFASELSPAVPVVLVTARPDMLSDISAGDFAAVLTKPVRAAELAHAVREAAKLRNTPQ